MSELAVELETPAGDVYRWEPNARSRDLEPQRITFNTALGEGFADGSVILPRRTDIDWPDLALLATVRFVDSEGFVAYEGRLSRAPRTIGSDGHSIQVQTQGWMSHAADRTFRRIYYDRDISKWTEPSADRRAALYTGGLLRINGPETAMDDAIPQLLVKITGATTATMQETAEAFYDAGYEGIGDVYYEATMTGPWTGTYQALVMAGDLGLSSFNSTGNLFGIPPFAGYLSDIDAPASAQRVAVLSLANTSAVAAEKDRVLSAGPLVVYGFNDLARVGDDPAGHYIDDMFKDIGKYAPLLDYSGVDRPSYIPQQAAFTTLVTPHEAWRALNNFSLWEMSVWEGRKMVYRQSDITDYNWQFRPGERGATSALEGYDADLLRNGLAVQFTDFGGVERFITPDDYDELRDTSETNPANQLGIEKWGDAPFQIPFTCVEADAVQIGAAQLAEMSRPRAKGALAARGTVLDAAGASQPAYAVRSNQSCILANHPSDYPRLIAATGYDHDSRSLTVNVERPPERASAQYARIQDRLSTVGV